MSTVNANDYQSHAFFAFSDSPSPLVPFSSVFSISSSSSSSSSHSSLPFIIDTGATCHISPILSNFKSLHPITSHPIRGLGNLCINAIGMGTIKLGTTSSTLCLNNMFYVPNLNVRLIYLSSSSVIQTILLISTHIRLSVSSLMLTILSSQKELPFPDASYSPSLSSTLFSPIPNILLLLLITQCIYQTLMLGTGISAIAAITL